MTKLIVAFHNWATVLKHPSASKLGSVFWCEPIQTSEIIQNWCGIRAAVLEGSFDTCNRQRSLMDLQDDDNNDARVGKTHERKVKSKLLTQTKPTLFKSSLMVCSKISSIYVVTSFKLRILGKSFSQSTRDNTWTLRIMDKSFSLNKLENSFTLHIMDNSFHWAHWTMVLHCA
jgi:hypothetical protein